MLESIAPFGNHLPIRIRFGEGVVRELPGVCAAEGWRHLYLLVDPGVRDLPSFTETWVELRRQADAVTVARPEAGEPTAESIDAQGEALRESGAQVIVAVGGGSVMDTSKGARVVAGQGGPMSRFAGGATPLELPAVSLVTVPTTAGSGSEVSGGIIFYDAAKGLKMGAAGPTNRAQYCLVDPELTYGLPRLPTLYGGIDALAQALAGVVATVHTPIGDAVGLEATRMAAAALPLVARDGTDRGARSHMSCAALMAGLTMNISEVSSEHFLGHAIGAMFKVPHGLTIGLMLAEAMEHDRADVPERFERVADALGVPADGTRDGSRAVRGIRRLLAELGLPTLRSVGVTEDHVEALTDAALAGWWPVSPTPWTRDDVAAAYQQALALESRG